jgi:peptidoglycan/xylan/chitin deacetylase (PgdA/CDA1 family)
MTTTRLDRILSLLAHPFYGGVGHILMFHRIIDTSTRTRVPGAANIEYPPDAFAHLLDELLNADYAFVSMDQCVEILTSGQKTKNFINVTFDDGYIDNFTTAYPILKERGIPFTIYVTTAFPDHKAVVWWYILEDMLNEDRQIEFEFQGQAYGFNTALPEEKVNFGRTARSLMKTASAEDLHLLISEILVKQGIDPLQKVSEVSLSWDQIKQLAADPLVTIGAHTVNHLLLKELPLDVAREEIFSGRDRLGEKLRKPVLHFAFPYGGSNAAGSREFNLVKEAEFKTGVTTRLANVFPQHNDHLECLPRLDMGLFPDFASLKTALDGWVPARMNHLKKVVTE